MRKAAMVAFVAVGSSLAVYAGLSHNATEQKNPSECCDNSTCCPYGDAEGCCSGGSCE